MLLREAVRRSEYPKRDIIVTLQADFSEEPEDVVPMIKRIEAGADLVLGNKVSVTRPTRVRRFARALGSFFTRSQQWPEGVTTPFDGYRAYRLYGVKRALEESGGRRLIRYDGWAGNAELLRAVIPHARRVEVLDVEDRSDRLQRPRRERPLASAMRVRPMARGIEPHGLVTVEELERVAATASRSRDPGARAKERSEPQRTGTYDRVNGRARQQRGPGARPRNGRERRPDRPQPADRPAPTRAEGARKPAADRPRSGRPDAGGPSRPDGPRQRGQGARPAAPVAADAAGAAPPPSGVDPVAEAGTPAASENGVAPQPARPKKRRRRRKRSAGGAAAATGSQANGADNLPESADVADLDLPDDQTDGEPDVLSSERSGTVEGSTDAREPKRRRRRGGRGRRRGARAASADAAPAGESTPASEAPGLPGDERAALPVVPPVPTAAPAPPTVSEEQ